LAEQSQPDLSLSHPSRRVFSPRAGWCVCAEISLPDHKDSLVLTHIITLGAASGSTLVSAGQAGLRSLAIALGGGLGAVGAGVGIGMIFSRVIESVTRQPEMRAEITSIQWLGFALTEAIFFYGLVAGLLAYVL
jgi:F-type H+-transporting ATPase subunit c